MRENKKIEIEKFFIYSVVSMIIVLSLHSSVFATSEVGKIIETENITYEVVGVEFSNENAFGNAPEGKKIIKYTLNVSNKSDEQEQLTAAMIFLLSDEDGCLYSVNLPEESSRLNGLIEGKETLKGTVSFIVPKDKDVFTLSGKSEINSNEVNLLKQNNGYESNNLLFGLNGVYTKKQDSYRIPEKNNNILYFDMSVTNNSQVQYGMTTMMVFGLKDSQNKYYTIVTPEGMNSLNGLIDPGETSKGIVRFEVPKSEVSFTLVIKPSMMSSETIEISINR